ncbi:hypothetical protein C8J55DRAFT_307170 [Lentinula edodes]|uniref:Uncharacterized protein n=1 Tax=Lentinula lateritia TaxID=40482 RepID=A0A9W9AVU6_9AGAR|nr:hypothetical protein C8J55DRAFT_307170 [Lentinula edodes]
MDTLPEPSSTKSDTPVTPTMGQSALDSKASDDFKLTKQATTNSESPTLVAKEQVKQVEWFNIRLKIESLTT